jgi:hypothetical protein
MFVYGTVDLGPEHIGNHVLVKKEDGTIYAALEILENGY